jgi:hypothetical protein
MNVRDANLRAGSLADDERAAQPMRNRHQRRGSSFDLGLPRHRQVAASAFIVVYAVCWAALVRLADPSHWHSLMALGFGALLALAMLAEAVVSTAPRRVGMTARHSLMEAHRHRRADMIARRSAALDVIAIVAGNSIPGPHD